MSGRPRRAFGIVSKVVMRSPGIPLGSKALYALLCAYADDDGCCFPSNETLAADLGVSDSSIVRGLRTLGELGLIVREPRYVDNRQTTSVTRITDLDVSDVTPRPVTDDTPEGGSGDTPGGVVGDTQNNTTSNGTTTNTSSSDDDGAPGDGLPSEDDLFADFWEFYPKKVARKEARAAFGKAMKRVDYPTVRAGLVRAIRYWRSAEMVRVEGKPDDGTLKVRLGADADKAKGVPNGATWLNGDRWEDQHPEATPATGTSGEEAPGWMHRTPQNTQ